LAKLKTNHNNRHIGGSTGGPLRVLIRPHFDPRAASY
jgi:hypothetical protein